jgi:hypothetical protein
MYEYGKSQRTLRGALIFPLPLDDRVDIVDMLTLPQSAGQPYTTTLQGSNASKFK